MDNFKQFNESQIVSSSTTEHGTDGGTKVILLAQFDLASENILRNQISNGLTPFFLNDNYEFEEILMDKNGYPYRLRISAPRNRYGRPIESKRKVSLKGQVNPYGNVYLISPEDLEDIQPLLDTVRKTIELIEQKKTMLIDLIGSKLTHK
tara:strand:+ start:951 stop:1400 length:450 start_codon:yes stop_codon:yes gene_type:complete